MNQDDQQTPSYFSQPGQSGYQPGYQPGQPGYQPGYQPGQPGYQPGQPGYQPGQPGYLPSQPPRRNRTGIWVGIGIFTVFLIGIFSVILFFSLQAQNSPTATLNHFCDGLKKQDAQEIYNTYSDSYRQTYKVNSVEDEQTALDNSKGQGILIKDCTANNVQQTGSTATGTIMLTATQKGMTGTLSIPVDLVQENGAWKIDKFEFPN